MAGTTNKIKLSEQWAGDRFQFFKKFIKGRNFVFSQDQSRSQDIAHILTAIAPANGAAWNEAEIAIAYADPFANDCTSKFQNRCITRMEAEEIRKIVAEAMLQMNQPAWHKHMNYVAINELYREYLRQKCPNGQIPEDAELLSKEKCKEFEGLKRTPQHLEAAFNELTQNRQPEVIAKTLLETPKYEIHLILVA